MNIKLYIKNLTSLRAILLLAIIVVSFLSVLMPIEDPDFFWHIATGKWILQNRTLPSDDPFSFTTPKDLELRDETILKGYWISQLLYYVSYLAAGYNGIIFLRVFIVLLLCLFLIKRRETELNMHLLSVLLSIFVIFNFYALDRPQVFSFLFFAVLLYLIDVMKKRDDVSFLHYLSIPLLLFIWANMHGGYILGQAVLSVYLITENLKARVSATGALTPGKLKRFSLVVILSLFSSLLNPLSYKTLLATFQFMKTSYFTQNIIEYSSTVEAFLRYNQYLILFYWLTALLTVIAFLYRIIQRRIDPADLLLTALFLYFSFTQVRYVAFFMIWSAPFLSSLFNALFREGFLRRSFITGSTLLILSLEIYTSGQVVHNLIHFGDRKWISPIYPSEIVRFIKAEGIKGNMYNFYGWGGYLIWELGPERKVFVDGRGLHSKVFATWEVLEQGIDEPKIGGRPYWRAILDTYNVKYVLLPISFKDGLLHPLVIKLLYERDWVPVFLMGNSILFVKDVPENRSVIYKYSIPKDTFIDDMIANIDWQIERDGSITLFISKGELYLLKNDLGSAEQSFRRVLKYSPFNTIARDRLRLIKSIKERGFSK